jgi:hypothetical protein
MSVAAKRAVAESAVAAAVIAMRFINKLLDRSGGASLRRWINNALPVASFLFVLFTESCGRNLVIS